jgi:hypothetical protein
LAPCSTAYELQLQIEKEKAMKVVAKPVSEKAVLQPTRKSADPVKIHAGIIAKAQCCVDHLCGCQK